MTTLVTNQHTKIADSNQPAAVLSSARIRNAMTIDVEDYFQVSAFAPYIARDSWPTRECRVEANIDRILAILADGKSKA